MVDGLEKEKAGFVESFKVYKQGKDVQRGSGGFSHFSNGCAESQ